MAGTRYDSIAPWYDTFVRSGPMPDGCVLERLFEAIGDVQGLTVCDLACGQGRVARELARRGARVVGIDLSKELLEIARREERSEPRGIHYLLDDAQALRAVADETFDGVVCHLALMDIPDLEATLRAAWRVLRPGSWLVFSITHPCFEAPHSSWIVGADGTPSRAIPHYIDEGYWRSDNAEGLRGKVGAYHRTVATYVNAMVGAGFRIEGMAEPRAAGGVVERIPGYVVVPGFLVAWGKKNVRCEA